MNYGQTPNDNRSVIRMLARVYGNWNRGRNRILFAAVVMGILTLVLTFGVSAGRLQAEYLRAVRKAGDASSGVIRSADLAQYRTVRGLSYIKRCGRILPVGNAEREETPGQSVCQIRWADRNAWDEIYLPAYTEFQGMFPEKTQEIVLSVQTLKNLGIQNPKEGMEIPLTVSVGLFQTEKETFVLSGWFQDYGGQEKRVSPGYVSLNKIRAWGLAPDEESDIVFSQKDSMDWQTAEEKLYEDVQVKDAGQQIVVSDTCLHDAVAGMAGGYEAAVLFAVLILCGMVFLVRNVMQISMAGDIRQMGLLHLIGMTGKQIRSMYYRQIGGILIRGVLAGLLLSSLLLLGVLPRMLGDAFLEEYGESDGLRLFRPELLAASVFLTAVVVLAVSAEVIRRMVRMSCVESAAYTGLSGRKKNRRHGRKKGEKLQLKVRKEQTELLWMAWKNMTRYRTRLTVTCLSLFLGVMTFLSAVVITGGSDYSHVIEKRPDFLIAGRFSEEAQREEGYGKEYESRDAGEDPMLTQGDNLSLLYDNEYDEFSPITPDVRKKLLSVRGIDAGSSYVMEGAYMMSVLSAEAIRPLVTDTYIGDLEEAKKESGSDRIGGSETDTIQILTRKQIEQLETYVKDKHLPVQMESLKDGTGVLILHDHRLSRKQEEQAASSVGEPVYFTTLMSRQERIRWNEMSREERWDFPTEGKQSPEFKLSGYLDSRAEDFPEIAQTWHGAEGMIYYLISEKGFEKLPTARKTLYMELRAEPDGEPEAKRQIQKILSEENKRRESITNTGIVEGTQEAGIFCISKSELRAKAAAYISGSRLLLGSISGVLLLAGLTNYLNVAVTGILARKQELETMKKIGMTGKQMRNMLLFEDGLYICILAAGIAVAGTVMMYILAWYMERKLSYFVFHYPGWWIAVLLGGMGCINIFIVKIMKRSFRRT